MNTDYTSIIKKKLKESNKTLSEVAEQLGTSQSSLTQSLGKDGNPSLKRLKEIANVLDISVVELLSDTPTNSQSPTCPHCGKELNITVS